MIIFDHVLKQHVFMYQMFIQYLNIKAEFHCTYQRGTPSANHFSIVHF